MATLHKPIASRRAFIAAATVLSVGFPAVIRSRGEAAETLRIGDIEPETGVFAAFAGSQRRGAAMAAEAWNQRGGVMGRQVEILVEDSEAKPGIGVDKARKLVREDHCVALTGTVNSAVTLAVSAASAAMNVLFIPSGGHADQISGKGCHWNTFQTAHSAWMFTHATGYSIAKELGKRWYFLTPDYAYGHTLARGYADVLKQVGGTIVGNALTPLGTNDFGPYIPKILTAKPDCVIILLAGSDFVNFMKQAGAYGVFGKTHIAGPLAELEAFWAIPPELRLGYWGTEWYYKGEIVFGKANSAAESFVRDYRAKHNTPPTSHVCAGYVAVDRMLSAMDATKTTDAVKLAQAVQGTRFHSFWVGESYYRDVDHLLMWPVWFGTIRPHGTVADPYDIIDVTARHDAASIAVPVAESAKICNLEWPVAAR